MFASLDSVETLMKRLKRETAPLHLAAEDRVTILSAHATEADYAEYLKTFYGFHAGIEARLAENAELEAAGFRLEARRKAQWLLADLRALGVHDTPPRCEDVPELRSLPRALGAGYVVEGSTLGGQYLLKKFPLQHLRGRATRFFEGYGSETGAMWRAFATLAEAHVNAAEADEAVRGAVETFEALIRWMDARTR